MVDGARVVVSSRSQESVDATVAGAGEPARGARDRRGRGQRRPGRRRAAGRAWRSRAGAGWTGRWSAWADHPPRPFWTRPTSSGVRVRVGVPRRRPAGRAPIAPHLPPGRVIGLVLSTLGQDAARRARDQQRAATRPGDVGQAARRRARPARHRGSSACCPGRVLTGRILELTPDRRVARPDGADDPVAAARRLREFGRVAAFLLSPAASYVTGPWCRSTAARCAGSELP